MSMEVREGEVLSLIGPNGAGKTTAFNAITGYLAPSSGEVVFQGKKLRGMKTDAIAALGLVLLVWALVWGRLRSRRRLDSMLADAREAGRREAAAPEDAP